MEDRLTFNELKIGDVYEWQRGGQFIKLSNAEVGVPLNEQLANSFSLKRGHYMVCGANAPVVRIKSISDFGSQEKADMIDKEDNLRHCMKVSETIYDNCTTIRTRISN